MVSQSNLICLSSCNLYCCNSFPCLYALVCEIMAQTILLVEAVTLLIRLKANLQNTTLIWSVEFIANARLELVYLGTFIRRLNVSLKLTVSF